MVTRRAGVWALKAAARASTNRLKFAFSVSLETNSQSMSTPS